MLQKSKILIVLVLTTYIANAQVKDSLFTFENQYVKVGFYGLSYEDNQLKQELLKPNMDFSKDYLLRINDNNTVDFQYNAKNPKFRRFINKVIFKDTTLTYSVNGITYVDTLPSLIHSIDLGNNNIFKVNYFQDSAEVKYFYQDKQINKYNLSTNQYVVTSCQNSLFFKDFYLEITSVKKAFGQLTSLPLVERLNINESTIHQDNYFLGRANQLDSVNLIKDITIYPNIYNYGYYNSIPIISVKSNSSQNYIIKSDSCINNQSVTLSSVNGDKVNWFFNNDSIQTNTNFIVTDKSGIYYYKKPAINNDNCSTQSMSLYLRICSKDSIITKDDSVTTVRDTVYTFENEYVKVGFYGKYYDNTSHIGYSTDLLQPNLDFNMEYLLRINQDNSIDFQLNNHLPRKYFGYKQIVVFKKQGSYSVNGKNYNSVEKARFDSLKTIQFENQTVFKANYFVLNPTVKYLYKGKIINQSAEKNKSYQLDLCQNYIIPNNFDMEIRYNEYLFGIPSVPVVKNYNMAGGWFGNKYISDSTLTDTIWIIDKLYINAPTWNYGVLGNVPLWVNNLTPEILSNDICFKKTSVKLNTENGKIADWYLNGKLIFSNKSEIDVTQEGKYQYKIPSIDSMVCGSQSKFIELKKCDSKLIKAFIDLNENFVKDSNETYINNFNVVINGIENNSKEAYEYSLDLDKQFYSDTIIKISKSNYFTTSCNLLGHSYFFNTVYGSWYIYDSLSLDVPLKPLPVQEGFINAVNSRFRPGFPAKIYPTIDIKENAQLSGTIEVYGNYPFILKESADIKIDSTFKPLVTIPFNTQKSVGLEVNDFYITRFARPNSYACYKVIVKAYNEKNLFITDTVSVCQIITASYDPNDISVSPQGPFVNGNTLANTDLDYTVRFQNTGNDTAFTVVVIDTLDENLVPSSLTMLSASHHYYVEVDQNIVTWTFPNILLPDSIVDSKGSNGYFKFRIKQKKDVALDTKISNRVGIYFDFNEVVLTNTSIVKIADLNTRITSIADVTDSEIFIYPNPAHEYITVEIKHAIDFTLFDLQGKKLIQKRLTDSGKIDISELEAGIYFCKLGDERIQKLIIQ